MEVSFDKTGLLFYSILALSPTFALKDLTFLKNLCKKVLQNKMGFSGPRLPPATGDERREREREHGAAVPPSSCPGLGASQQARGETRVSDQMGSQGSEWLRLAAKHWAPCALPELSRPALRREGASWEAEF